MKLLMENWRKFLNERELSNAAKTFVAGKDKGLEEFVTMLKQIASDPDFRRLAFAGKKDAGGAADERLKITDGTPVPAKDLTPTQMDIDMEKSLGK